MGSTTSVPFIDFDYDEKVQDLNETEDDFKSFVNGIQECLVSASSSYDVYNFQQKGIVNVINGVIKKITLNTFIKAMKYISVTMCQKGVPNGYIYSALQQTDVLIVEKQSACNMALLRLPSNLFSKSTTVHLELICSMCGKGKGKGKELMEFIETFGKKNGYDKIELESIPNAVEFYKNIGYQIVDENDNKKEKTMRKSMLGGAKMYSKKVIKMKNGLSRTLYYEGSRRMRKADYEKKVTATPKL